MRRPPPAPRPDGHPSGVTVESVFPAVPASVAAARRFVAAALARAGVDGDTAGDAMLAASELVTNALLHATGAIRVAVSVSAATVRVEVLDTDRRVEPVLRRAVPADAPSGRGLHIVDALSTRWSARPRRHGKAVWFELERS